MALEQFVDQLTHVPTDVERPVALVGAAVVGTALLARDWVKSKFTSNEFAKDYRENAALMDQAIKDVQAENQGKKVVDSRWHRLGTRVLLVAGISLGAGLVLAQPTTSVPTSSRAGTMNLLEGSDIAETLTDDVQPAAPQTADISRFTAAEDALQHSSLKGSFSLFEVANTQAPVIVDANLSSSSTRATLSTLDPSTTNIGTTEGTNLVAAMQADALLLPKDGVTSSGLTKRSGELTIYSDGDINDSGQDLKAEVKTLKSEGIKLDVIVAGTPDGTFNYNGSKDNASGIQPNIFIDSFGSGDVHVTDSVSGIEQQINAAARNAETTVNSNEFSYLAFLAPALLIAWGLRRQGKQVRGKVVN